MLGFKRKTETKASQDFERIKETVQTYLQGCGRTARDLSDNTGFSESSIENWKAGRNQISLENALIVAESLGLDIGLND